MDPPQGREEEETEKLACIGVSACVCVCVSVCVCVCVCVRECVRVNSYIPRANSPKTLSLGNVLDSAGCGWALSGEDERETSSSYGVGSVASLAWVREQGTSGASDSAQCN